MTAANETAFANYFVKYIQAYQAAGVHIDYITLQNEPLNITTSYPSMGMSSDTQLSLAAELRSAGANGRTTSPPRCLYTTTTGIHRLIRSLFWRD